MIHHDGEASLEETPAGSAALFLQMVGREEGEQEDKRHITMHQDAGSHQTLHLLAFDLELLSL